MMKILISASSTLIGMGAFLLLVQGSAAMAHGDHNHAATTKAARKASAHEHSPWTVGAGVSASKQFDQITPHDHDSSSTTGVGTQQGSSASGGHSHLRLLDGDHDHSGGGSPASGSGSTASDPHNTPVVIALTANASYMLSHSWSLGLIAGYDDHAGIQDPIGQVALKNSISKTTSWISTLGAAAPVSKISQDTYKITTVSFSTGPEFRVGKWTTTLAAKASSSWYSKTVLSEEEAKKEGVSLRPASGWQLHGDDEHTPTSSSAEATTSTATNREFNRYGGAGATAYKMSPTWKLSSGAGAAYIERQFGSELYETTANVVQVSALISGVTGTMAFQLSSLDESISVPATPVVVAGVEWVSQ